MSNQTEEPIIVRVSSHKRKFLYVDYTKHRLHEGASCVIISGLGTAITDAVSVAEMLKNKGLVDITKICTTRGDVDGARASYVDKIEITVTKTANFEAAYEEQERARQANANANHEDEEEGEDDE